MATNFPTTLDAWNNPTATTNEDDVGYYHDEVHGNHNDSIEAVEAKVGIDNSSVVTSLDYRVRDLEGYAFTPAGDDDLFNDESFSGWTTVEGGSTTLTVTEAHNRCSVVHNGGGAAAYFIGRFKAHTFSTNDWCEAAFTIGGTNQSHNMMGISMSNGTTWGTSNAFHWLVRTNNATYRRQGNNGFNADTSQGEYGLPQYYGGLYYLRLRYEGSNTFRGYASCDGISWIDLTGAQSYTLTPTHWGFSMTTWGGSVKSMMSLAYFRTGNG